MKVTYNIHRFYNSNGVFAEPYRTVTVDSNSSIGKEIISAFEHAESLYVGACYAGCQITEITEEETERKQND